MGRMRAFAALSLVICTGCSHTAVQYGTTVASGSSTTVTANSGAVYVQGGAPMTFFVLTTLLIASAVGPSSQQSLPEMKADRVINEQDCTKPIDLSAGNLRCR